jgi:putative endonuclease
MSIERLSTGQAIHAVPSSPRPERGARAWQQGHHAEIAVQRHYLALGLTLLARRWRGDWGEIDLIFADGAAVVFVEVKSAPTLSAAALRLSARQRDRIFAAAEEFCDGQPRRSLTDRRFELAMVDRTGRIAVRSDVFWSD